MMLQEKLIAEIKQIPTILKMDDLWEEEAVSFVANKDVCN